MKTIVIVGGGFSGTIAAVNLARLANDPLRVVIVNTSRPLGRGTAYSTTRNEHLLNVAARNMSALPDYPEHFLGWLRSRSEFSNLTDHELREMYVPRKIYGDYLCGLLATCQQPIDARCNVTVQTIDDQVVDIVVTSDEPVQVCLESGESIDANQVLLATGNQPPGSFPSDALLSHDPRYRSDDLDMRLQVNDRFAVIESNGQPSRWMFAMGPLLKGSLWETTAVSELRGQAMRIAEILLERAPVEVPQQGVLKYYI
jgi:uncharacterized NAD(P)/FAD-binding protein YdhS